MTRDPVDFNTIEPRYRELHGRLENWARSLRSPAGFASAPGFGLAVSAEHWEPAALAVSVDTHDALRIDKAVRALPQAHRIAIQWFYVSPGPAIRVRRLIGCTLRGLDDLVRAGRAMLCNRGA